MGPLRPGLRRGGARASRTLAYPGGWPNPENVRRGFTGHFRPRPRFGADLRDAPVRPVLGEEPAHLRELADVDPLGLALEPVPALVGAEEVRPPLVLDRGAVLFHHGLAADRIDRHAAQPFLGHRAPPAVWRCNGEATPRRPGRRAAGRRRPRGAVGFPAGRF